MRQWFLAFVITAAGCAAQGLPIGGGNGSGPHGGGGSAGSAGMPTGDLPDLARPLGPVGAPCQTACDCMPGLACPNGMCGKSQFGAIYCCDSANCPDGNFCQSSDGSYGQCMMGGMGGGGGPPFFGDMASFPADGGFSYCRQIMCGQDSDCSRVGCASCGRYGTCR